MTANVVHIFDRVRPIPDLVVSERVVRLGADEYLVRNVLDRKRGRGTVKITEVDSGVMVMVRPCGLDDRDLVTAAISCWRAGIYRGRAQMQEAFEVTS